MVEFAETISPEINVAIHGLAEALENAKIPGIVECTPCYCSLGVHYDPLQIQCHVVMEQLSQLLTSKRQDWRHVGRRVEIPVVYGGDFGPDLEWVASTHGLNAQNVVALHSEPVYRVFMIGFTPGFPYLGGLPETLACPRLPSPRTVVPTGSVAIGGLQCGIYPVNSPGGWRIIGRTPLRLFDVRIAKPSLLAPGDEVVFRRIDEQEFFQIASQAGTSS